MPDPRRGNEHTTVWHNRHNPHHHWGYNWHRESDIKQTIKQIKSWIRAAQEKAVEWDGALGKTTVCVNILNQGRNATWGPAQDAGAETAVKGVRWELVEGWTRSHNARGLTKLTIWNCVRRTTERKVGKQGITWSNIFSYPNCAKYHSEFNDCCCLHRF